MVPAKTDPRWRELVSGARQVRFTALATRICFTRVRVLGGRPDEASIAEAIELAHGYFTRNEKRGAEEDLRLAFPEGPDP